MSGDDKTRTVDELCAALDAAGVSVAQVGAAIREDEAAEIDPARWKGNCYEAAAKAQQAHPGSILVHGYPIGRGAANGGRHFGHAWIEIPELESVIDWTVSAAPIPLPAFYLLGQIDSSLSTRYDATGAALELCRAKHFGPWRDPPPGALFNDWPPKPRPCAATVQRLGRPCAKLAGPGSDFCKHHERARARTR